MKFKNEDGWNETVEAQSGHPYGMAVMTYAQRWAEMMEERIANGERLDDIAKETSQEADKEGITGFMYGCAVSILSQTWEHGEERRRWHNLETQIGDEGEKANKEGKTLNPALLCIGVEKK